MSDFPIAPDPEEPSFERANWKGVGRRPLWPDEWLTLCVAVGGSFKLRAEVFGYSSKTTLSDKIHGRSPWSKADLTIIGFLCSKHGLDQEALLKPSKRGL